jgi:hypothetical protein
MFQNFIFTKMFKSTKIKKINYFPSQQYGSLSINIFIFKKTRKELKL